MSATKKGVLLLVVRLIIGGIFINAGWMKVSDMAGTVAQFSTMGIPAFLAYAVGYLELIGGIAVLVGAWAYLASAVLVVIMAVAVYLVYPMGLQMVMTPLVTLAALLGLMASGSGKFSVREMKEGEMIG